MNCEVKVIQHSPNGADQKHLAIEHCSVSVPFQIHLLNQRFHIIKIQDIFFDKFKKNVPPKSYSGIQKRYQMLKIFTRLVDKTPCSGIQNVLLCFALSHIYNKRPMGHIAHLRKQFKSINTYDYIITLIKRRKKNIITLFYCFFINFEETLISLNQVNFFNVFSPLGKGQHPSFEQT